MTHIITIELNTPMDYSEFAKLQAMLRDIEKLQQIGHQLAIQKELPPPIQTRSPLCDCRTIHIELLY